MAVDFSRMRMKRSTIPGTVPTIPPVLDINTFLNTDIFPGELFYNMPDNKLYISDGTNINLITMGSGPGGCIPILNLEVINACNNILDLLASNNGSIGYISALYTTATNAISEFLLTENISGVPNILIQTQDAGATYNNAIRITDDLLRLEAANTVYGQGLEMSTAGGTINLANGDIASGASNSLLLNSNNKELFLTSFDPINATANITLNSSATPATDFSLSIGALTNRLQFDGTQIQLIRTDGVNFNNRLEVLDADMLFEAEDLIGNRQANLELRHNYTYFSHFNNGLLSYIQAQDDTIDLQTQDGTTLNKIALDSSNNNIEITTTSQFNDISFIETSYNTLAASPLARLKTEDTTGNEVSELTLSNSSFISTVSDLSSTSFIAQSPTEVNLTTDTYVINVKTSQIELNKPLLNTGAWIHKIENERTFNATPTRLDVISFNVPDRVISINATINAYSSTGTQAYGARLFAAFKNVGGTLTQLGTTDKVECTDFTTATSDILIVNPFGTDIDIQVTGEAANTTLWTVRYEYQITP